MRVRWRRLLVVAAMVAFTQAASACGSGADQPTAVWCHAVDELYGAQGGVLEGGGQEWMPEALKQMEVVRAGAPAPIRYAVEVLVARARAQAAIWKRYRYDYDAVSRDKLYRSMPSDSQVISGAEDAFETYTTANCGKQGIGAYIGF